MYRPIIKTFDVTFKKYWRKISETRIEKNIKCVKILRKDENHHFFTYQERYNTEVNFDRKIDCDKGLHFCKEAYISDWFDLGEFDGHYRQVITSVNPVKNNKKYKAKTIFVGPKQKFTEEMYIEAVKKSRYFIKYIQNPSQQVKLEATLFYLYPK